MQVDNSKDLDVTMYKYAKTSGSLWQYFRDEPDDDITDSKSFKFKSRFLYNTNNAGTTVQMAVSFIKIPG